MLAVVAVAVVAFSLVPTDRAWACSCAQSTLEEVLEREPDAAVVRVRRIDSDGGSSGVGQVQEVLHGPEMPEQLPLALDDGASCLPWIPVSDVAVLTFVPGRDGWRTLECGLLDPTVGVDPVTVDSEAAGPVAVVVAGRFPDADLVALDDELRVMAVGALGGVGHGMEPCGDDLVVPTAGPEGETSLALVDLADLGLVDERLLSAGSERDIELLAVSCDAGEVDVLTASWGETRRIWLHEDVFGADRQVELPSADDAAFVGDDVLLLRNLSSDAGAALVRYGRGTGAGRTLVTLEGLRGNEVSIAPDGGHALVRGFDEDPVLVVVDLSEGREVARSTGWWQPVPRPWLRADRFLQLDENSGGIGDSTGLAQYRIVDLRLEPIATLDPTPARSTASGYDRIAQVDGDSLDITDAAGDRLRSTTARWAAGVHDTLVVGPITAASSEMAAAELPAVDPTVARAARSDLRSATIMSFVTALGPATGITLIALAALALSTAFVLRRWPRIRRPPMG